MSFKQKHFEQVETLKKRFTESKIIITCTHFMNNCVKKILDCPVEKVLTLIDWRIIKSVHIILELPVAYAQKNIAGH